MSLLVEILTNNNYLSFLVLFISFDIIFGVLRAIKERKLNSCIGIDGMIRKCGMILSIILCLIIDKFTNIDFIAFIPKELKDYFHINKAGVTFLFDSLYIIFEILSILKNMVKCKLPIPKKLKNLLEKLLTELTKEME